MGFREDLALALAEGGVILEGAAMRGDLMALGKAAFEQRGMARGFERRPEERRGNLGLAQQIEDARKADAIGVTANDGARRHGLAAARFADDAETFAALDLERHFVDDREAAPGFDPEIADGKERRRHHRVLSRGSSRSRKASPSRLTPSSVSALQKPARRKRWMSARIS